MQAVGAFEAKTHFSQLLLEVAKGNKIIITKHGQRVAMLVPFESQTAQLSSTAEAIQSIRSLRKGVTLGKGLTIKSMREEGQKK